jgi:N-acetylglucosaminyldiphosphoundecaprenol N-acetyl-beta-D-mannosaminyltransferase
MTSESTPCTHVFGLPCADTYLDAAARHLVRCAAEGVDRRVVFVNAHCLNRSVHDAELERAIHSADLIFADGVGMAIAARIHGERLKHNVNGTDLFPHLCHYADAARLPVALLGGVPGVSEACADAIESRYPGIEVVWERHGYVEAQDEQDIVRGINRSGARTLLVAMGVPRQERWIMDHRQVLEVPVVLGVGGLFDFVSGSVPRAPEGVRKLRLEWLFRLMVEPRRLFMRYVVGNPLFLLRAIRYGVTGSLWSGVRGREVAPR